MINIVKLSHDLLSEHNNPKVSVDMTCGNGFDTLFLSKISEEVYAFDIQDIAIERTKKLLSDNSVTNVSVIKESHDKFDNHLEKNIDIAIYNLGYLPNGDKSIKTNVSTVIESLKKALDKLNQLGLIVIVIYLHNQDESKIISEFVSNLDDNYDVLKYQVLNKKDCPYIIKIIKKEKE